MKKISYHLFDFIIIILVLILIAGCKQMGDSSEKSSENNSTGDHMASEFSEKTSEDMSDPFTGTVVETIYASRYTYVQVDTGEKKVWVASPAFNGQPGDVVAVPSGLPMADFKSKTLDREFEMIYFVGAIHRQDENEATLQEPELPKDHPPVTGRQELPEGHPAEAQMTHPPMSGMPDSPAVESGEIKPAAGGQTVSEIITGRKRLAGKKVKVRAKVVKFTPDIMGKNWLHVQDGTGDDGTNDLIVTTGATVNVGDVVLIRGVVSADRDFGYGLKYPVIIENADVMLE